MSVCAWANAVNVGEETRNLVVRIQLAHAIDGEWLCSEFDPLENVNSILFVAGAAQ